MKNVKIFCQMAMHIKTVKTCDVTRAGIPISGREIAEGEVCLIGNAFRAGLITDNTLARDLAMGRRDIWLPFFGVEPPHELLFPPRPNAVDEVSGETYYNECVKFLKKYRCLSVLRRMENQAKAA